MVMKDELLRPVQHIGKWGKVWIGFLVAVCMCGIYAYYIQETKSKYAVSYTHLRAHETVLDLVCRLLLEKKKTQ